MYVIYPSTSGASCPLPPTKHEFFSLFIFTTTNHLKVGLIPSRQELFGNVHRSLKVHNNQSKQLTLRGENGQKMLITMSSEISNQNCYHTDKEWTEYQFMTFTGYTHLPLHFATNNKYHQWYQVESNKIHNVSDGFRAN